jgi:hypothetical protein
MQIKDALTGFINITVTLALSLIPYRLEFQS